MARTAALLLALLAVLASACSTVEEPRIQPVAAEIPTAPALETAGGATLPPPGTPPAGWAGKWRRWGGRFEYGQIEIREVSAAGFAFNLSAGYGAHVGGAEGKAAFTPEGARFVDPPGEGCGLSFRLRDGGVDVEQDDGFCVTYGASVTSAGRYRPEGEKRVYGTSFDCRRATAPVEATVCASPVLAAADRVLATAFAARLGAVDADGGLALRVQQRAWLRERDACRDAVSPERCAAGAYRRRLAALGGGHHPGFDFAAFRRRIEGPGDPWTDVELQLYLVEQLPPARYEALATAMMISSTDRRDAGAVEMHGCVYGLCPWMAAYVRAEPSGAMWVAVYGDDGAVVFSPKKGAVEPGSLGRWLEEHGHPRGQYLPRTGNPRVVRERVFE